MRVKTIWDIGKNLNRIPLEQEYSQKLINKPTWIRKLHIDKENKYQKEGKADILKKKTLYIHISDRGLIYKIYKELHSLNTKCPNQLMEKMS